MHINATFTALTGSKTGSGMVVSRNRMLYRRSRDDVCGGRARERRMSYLRKQIIHEPCVVLPDARRSVCCPRTVAWRQALYTSGSRGTRVGLRTAAAAATFLTAPAAARRGVDWFTALDGDKITRVTGRT